MIGLFLFASTTVLFPSYILMLPFVFLLVFRRLKGFANVKDYWFFISVFALISVNRLFGIMFGIQTESMGLKAYIPYQLLFIVSYMLGRSLDDQDRQVFIALICAEIVVGVLEYVSGTTSFFGVRDTFTENDLLYMRRVAGLSDGVGVFAQKILVALLLWGKSRPFRDRSLRLRSLGIMATLGVGFFVTFNRTAIACAALYFGLKLFSFWFDNKNTAKGRLLLLFIITGVAITVPQVVDEVSRQFFRGAASFSLEGRGEIWGRGFEFIVAHPLVGNNSFPLRMDLRGSLNSHFHNSFLQMTIDNGAIIAGMFFIWILRRVKKANFVELLVFLAYSVFQYGLFWGLSFFDVFFYMFLFSCKESSRMKTIQNTHSRIMGNA